MNVLLRYTSASDVWTKFTHESAEQNKKNYSENWFEVPSPYYSQQLFSKAEVKGVKVEFKDLKKRGSSTEIKYESLAPWVRWLDNAKLREIILRVWVGSSIA